MSKGKGIRPEEPEETPKSMKKGKQTVQEEPEAKKGVGSGAKKGRGIAQPEPEPEQPTKSIKKGLNPDDDEGEPKGIGKKKK